MEDDEADVGVDVGASTCGNIRVAQISATKVPLYEHLSGATYRSRSSGR